METNPSLPSDEKNTDDLFPLRKLSWPGRLGILLFCIFAIGVIYWPIASGSGVFAESSWAILEHYSVLAFMESSIKTYHELPLWFANIFSGFPTFVAHDVGINQPLSLLLVAITDFITAFNTATLFYLLSAILLAVGLARYLRLSVGASIIAAFTYGFSQFVIVWSHADTLSQSFFFPPLLIFLIFKIHERAHPLRYTVIGGAAFALVLIGGFIDITVYTMLAGFVLAVLLDSGEGDSAWYHYRRWYATKRLLVMGGIGALLAAPSILPTLSFIHYSIRASGYDFMEAGARGSIFLRELPLLIYPHFTPDLPYFFHGKAWVYMGTLSLALGGWGVISHRLHHHGKTLLWILIGSVATLLPYSPLYWLIQHLPPLTILHASWKLLPVPILIMGIFAGTGFDALRYSAGRQTLRVYARFWTWFTVLVFAGAASFNIVWNSTLLGVLENRVVRYLLESRGGVKSAEHYHEVFRYFAEQARDSLSFTNHRFALALIFLAATTIILVVWSRKNATPKFLPVITFFLVVLNFLFIWQDERRFLPRDLYAMPPTFRAIKREGSPEPFRIAFAIPDGATATIRDFASREEKLLHFKLALALGMRISPTIFGVETADGTNPLVTPRYDSLVKMLTPVNYRGDTPEFISLSLAEKTRVTAERIPIYSMMNVRYLITTYELPNPWKKISDDIVSGVRLRVYENPEVLPRVYFPDTVTYLEVDEKDNFLLLQKNADFRKNTFVECLPKCPKDALTEYAGDADAQIITRTPRKLRLTVKTASSRWLVVSDHNLPFWQARVDGAPVTIYTANYVYRGIILPSGEHTVEFSYPGLFHQAWYALHDLLQKHTPYAPYRLE